MADEDPHVHIGCTAIDLPLITADNIHRTPRGQQIQAERIAQSFLQSWYELRVLP